MARNGSGVYSKVNTFVSGNTITAAGHNQNWDDLVAEMTNSVAADGQTTMTGAFKAASGTNSAPGLGFASDPDTGLYRSAANEASIAAGGTQIAAVNSSGIDVKTGDVNVATGTFKLAGVAAFPIGTSQISNDAVTYAKIQNVSATSRLLGRSTSGAGDVEEITLGSNMSMSGGALISSTDPASVRGFLSGLELVNVGTSGSLDISPGAANDVSAGGMMALTATLRKTTSSWAVGDATGGLDTGAIATNTWYHFFLIKRPDTGVVDVLFSLSATAPTMPGAGAYTLKRRIGSAKTNGSSQWTLFTQVGDEFLWDAPVNDVNTTATPSGSQALTVPPGVSVLARTISYLSATTASSTMLVYSGLGTAQSSGTPTGNTTITTQNNNVVVTMQVNAITDTSRQVRLSGNGTGTPAYGITTYGWNDRRGK